MRIAAIVLGLLLVALPAWADVDYSVSLDVSSGDGYYYFSNGNWYWGDPVSLQGVSYSSTGLTIGVNDGDWGARFNTGRRVYPYRYPYSFSSSYRPVERFDSIITPLEPLIEPYTGRTNNIPGRNGYGVAIPRPTGGAPELYGRYEYDEYGRPVPEGAQSIYPTINPGYYSRRNRPLVIHYSYGYPYYNNYYPQPVYTAPSCPEYGYASTGGRQYYPVNDPGLYGDTQEIRAEEVNVYQGEVHNHYYENQPAPAPAPAQPVEAIPPADTSAVEPTPAVAYGTRFFEVARLETPGGVEVFTLRDGRLGIGDENGPAQLVCDGVDPDLGAYACYTDLDGIVLLFAREGRIAAAYRAADGNWWVEPLPYDLEPGGKTTIGLVGSAPWAVFNSRDGNRYVMVFTDHQWQELGSGSVSPGT